MQANYVRTFLGVLIWSLSFAFICISQSVRAQDTFSIVAVDTVTGEVGSAGASCIQSSIIISDVHPGIGAIHTQAYWNSDNQSFGYDLMEAHHTPSEIIDSLRANDAEGTPAFRQYGVVTLAGPVHSAGFTGDSCMDYKNHIVGPYYCIQGNILKDSTVLEQIESNFLAATGPLADRLMAGLQGAKIPGADTRCIADGTSSKSSFLRVAKKTDGLTSFSLDLNVPAVPTGVEPIDSLQHLYNQWKASSGVTNTPVQTGSVRVTASADETHIAFTIHGITNVSSISLTLINCVGTAMKRIVLNPADGGDGIFRVTADRSGLASGVYFYRLYGQPRGSVPQSVMLGAGKVIVE